MKLDKQFRFLLATQLKILEDLHPDEAQRYRHGRLALEGGYELHYAHLFEAIEPPMDTEECHEVQDILEMHSQMWNAFARLGKARGAKKGDIRFRGFDEATEGRQLSYTRYLIEELGRYDELVDKKRHGFRAEMPMLGTYRRMLAIWKLLDDRLRFKLDRLAMMQVLEARGWSDDGWDADDD